MANILITGGAGYIGSHVVHYLLQQGYDPKDIVVFDNLVYGDIKFVPKDVNFVKGDLLIKNDINNVFNKFDVGTVVHFAAYAYVGESMIDPGKYFENNIHGGLNLLTAMIDSNCRQIVFSSTCATYGLPATGKINEDTPLVPINPYGESKLIFEKILQWYYRIYEVRSISLRYFNAAGADFGIGEKHDPETHIIPLLIETALGKRQMFTLYGDDYDTQDGTCIRDYIHVSDLARAHFSAVRYLRDKSVCEAINLGTGHGASVQDIVTSVQQMASKKFVVKIGPRRPGDPPVLVADFSKAARLLDWTPQKDIQDILQSAWEWHTR